MDLIIEAKDKEQVVFELMPTFKLPSFDTFNDNLPYQRTDENKAWKLPKKKTQKKQKGQVVEDVEPEADAVLPPAIPTRKWAWAALKDGYTCLRAWKSG
jgi:UV DNA damage endonuclease